MNYDLVLSTFKIRLLCMLGFTPRFNECVGCKDKDNISFFSIKDDGVKCINCGRVDKSAINISKATYIALKYIIMAPPKKLFGFKLSDECIKELTLISNIYFNQKLEKEYKLENLF